MIFSFSMWISQRDIVEMVLHMIFYYECLLKYFDCRGGRGPCPTIISHCIKDNRSNFAYTVCFNTLEYEKEIIKFFLLTLRIIDDKVTLNRDID